MLRGGVIVRIQNSKRSRMSGANQTVEDWDQGDCRTTQLPYRVEQHLDFIDIFDDGSLLLGSSNLNGRYWNGSIWYYKNADFAPSNDKCLTGHSCESGVTVGKFLDTERKVIVGEDSGVLTIYNVLTFEDEAVHFVPQSYASQHDSSVLTLSVSTAKDKVVSAGTDRCIIIWDIQTLSALQRYWFAHTRPILSTGICPEKESPIFGSCSLDGTALLWDPRNSKPAQVIKEDKHCGLTSLDWRNTNEIAFGSQFGDVSLVDVRTCKQLSVIPMLDRPIHKIAFGDNGMLAVCGDSNLVTVWNCSSNACLYSDERHSNFVRDVVWHPKSKNLYSCGYDQQVFSHCTVQASAA